jgi:dTDP-4-amino-4,6-dideoxygalactose transaminase
MEPYRSMYADAGLHLPQTAKLVERLLSLPTGTSVGKAEIKTICGILRLAIKLAPKVRSRLRGIRPE